MTKNPRIRANWTRMLLDYHRTALPPGLVEQIRARVPARSLEAIDNAGTFDWLPAEHHLAFVDAAAVVLGARESEDCWRRMTGASFEKPLFRPILQGAKTLFSSTPISLARVLPTGWSLVGTDCGVFSVEPDTGKRGLVYWKEIPPLLSSCKPFVGAWRGALRAFLDVFGATGDVSVDESQLAAQQQIMFVMRWT